MQNEFTPANIDGADLKSTHEDFEILAVNNGSVFCVCLLNDFISSLSSFVDQHQPDLIFMEVSEPSDHIAIAQLMDFKEFKSEFSWQRSG